MRQIVLDTETTGLSAENGDRIIEIGCVELFNRKLTGNNLHFYVNPERDSHEDALKVHGISNEFLRDKPKFSAIADELLEYLRDAELIIHNAPFDISFLNKELERLGKIDIEADGDTFHNAADRVKADKERNNELSAAHWHLLRFTGEQIRERMAPYCMTRLTELVNRLGGLEETTVAPRVFYESSAGSVQQLALLEDEAPYELD